MRDTGNLILSTMLSAAELGSVDLMSVFATGINEDWFENEAQKIAFDVMRICFDGGVDFDESTIVRHLKAKNIQNPESIVLDLMSQTPVPQGILLEHIEALKESFQRKELHAMHLEIAKMLEDESNSSAAIMQTVQNSLDGYIISNKGRATKSLAEVRRLRKLAPPVKRMETGIGFIDTVLTDKHGNKGLRNEGLVFVSGKKQAGKTFILTKIIENISQHSPVLFGSLEFGEDLYDENVESQQEDGNFEGNIENIYTFDTLYDINEVCAEIKLAQKLYGIKIAIIDSQMRLSNTSNKSSQEEKRTSDMFSKLGKLTKELKIPIIVVVQTAKEDLKSSNISVKGSIDADHEAYIWFHITKTNQKDTEDELRTVVWAKNKDTMKHPIQHIMFVPQTSDFYRVELDEHGNPAKALDKYRRHTNHVETVFEEIPKEDMVAMPEFNF